MRLSARPFAPTPGPLGLPNFANATNSHPFWGAGFQVGLLYELNDNWNLGFSYKSPVWQQKWVLDHGSYANGSARSYQRSASLASLNLFLGCGVQGNRESTDRCGSPISRLPECPTLGQKLSDGGLGWKGVFAVALGTQYAVTDKLTLPHGYLFNTNPISSPGTLFNVQARRSPSTLFRWVLLINQGKHDSVMCLGHSFDNSIQGPIIPDPRRVREVHDTVRHDLGRRQFLLRRPQEETPVRA